MTRRTKIVLSVTIGGILLLCGGCGAMFLQLFREMPHVLAGSDAFLDELGRGRIDEAYRATAPAFQAAVTPDRFRAIVAQYPVLTKQDRRTVGNYRIQNFSTGTVQYTIANANNSVSLTLVLGKIDGRWKVLGLNLP
jgi:hypothetical protein